MIKKTYIASIILFNVFFLSVNPAIADKTSKPKHSSGQFFNNSEKKVLVENDISGSCKALKNNNVSEFEWNMIESNEMFEICLLELAKQLISVERMETWFQNQGFFGVVSRSTMPGKVLLEAHWNLENSGSYMPFEPDWVFWMEWFSRRYTYDASVTYSHGIPEEANASHRTK